MTNPNDAGDLSEPGDVPRPAPQPPVMLQPLDVPATGGLRLQHLMFAVVVCAFLLWVGIVAGLWLVTGSLVLLVAAALGLAVVLARRGSTQQESLLWALAIASERGMPLAPAALAFADQYSGGYRWRVQLLATLLDEGKTLPEAIDKVPGLLGGEAKILVKTGWSTGALAGSLKQAAGLRAAQQAAWGSVLAGFTYIAAAVFGMQVIIGFVMYFILPKYQAIFADFGIDLPAITVFTIRVGHAITGFGGIPLMLLLLVEVVALFCVPLGLFRVFGLDIPLVDRLFRRRHSALVLRSLALSVAGGRPIDANLQLLSEDYPAGWVRRRLRKATTAVRNGYDWIESLRTYGLLSRADAAVLASAQRVGNLEWALNEVATSTERRLGYRLRLWLETLFPLLVLLMGTVVGVIAVAYFIPLITLIARLAG